jgi:hypothetical protein
MHITSLVPIILFAATAKAALAQPFHDRNRASDAEVGSMLAFNALIGGSAAAIRAFIGDRDVSKAFALGTIGGTVYGAGKVVASRTGSFPFAGVLLGATGTSIVSNSGRGAAPLEEITIPIAVARVRIRPYSASRVSFAINAYEAVIAAQAFSHDALRFESRTSLASGALVFHARRHRIIHDGQSAGGIANGSVVVISAFPFDLAHIRRHELAHVQQYWFSQEMLDRPAQESLRSRFALARRLPSWLELGVISPGFYALEHAAFGKRGPVHQFIEHEAEILARQ